MEDAASVVDPFLVVDWRNLATKDDTGELDARMDRLEDRVNRLEARVDAGFSELRRDLLKVTGAQYVALIAAVAAVLGFG